MTYNFNRNVCARSQRTVYLNLNISHNETGYGIIGILGPPQEVLR